MFDRIFDRILMAGAILSAVIIAYVVLTVDFEVVMRFGFNSPTTWVVDFSEYAMLYVTLLTSAWLLSKDGHVKIDVILELLPARVKRVLNVTTSVIAALACLVFFLFGAWMTLESAQKAQFLVHATIVPKWPVWIVMPIGSLFLVIQFARRAWGFARGHEATAAEIAEV